jgi:plastocyanin
MNELQKPIEPIIRPVPVVDTSELFQPDAVPVPPPKRFSLHKVVSIVAVALVMVAGGTAAALALRSSRNRTPPDTQQATGQVVVGQSDENEEIGEEPDPITSQKAPEVSAPTAVSPAVSPSPSPSSSPVIPKTYTVNYTSSCFSPSSLTIKRDETVKFVNNSNKYMWPASDDHPSHSIYPEFDSKSGIAPGGTYSFIFTKVGAWGYHDHNKPGCNGTITVQ